MSGDTKTLHMRLGEGSAWHMMRFLGHHRNELNRQVGDLIGGEVTAWFDFHFDTSADLGDDEWEGLDFLKDEKPEVHAAWCKYWPQTGKQQNWDAVGKAMCDGVEHLLLVEAKAHTGEVGRETVGGGKSKEKIGARFEDTRAALGIGEHEDWFKPYYQYANRLATLHFLRSQPLPAKLLMVYFVGDEFEGRTCPKDAEGWQPTLKKMDDHLGLTGGSELEKSVHKLFLHVYGTLDG